ncbi:ATP synthase protein I [Methylobacterium phyllostachyos]|uniref:ATP synthase protein I n=1 Tax=Methylobacterium phyllostachyos TaxID=582672 RepID=A0A1G9T2T0_9HYPH|nr:AtpZ/AtpI family protein [Methylobacterium phyllostachyos]SDM41918.1 ATP synthase protein I [Methylobacterium phyllostachyos]
MNGDDARDGNGTEGTPTDSELSARLRRLETQIERKRPQAAADPSMRPRTNGSSSLGQAMTLSTEFVAGVIAGGILGWIVDHVFGTKPWGLIVLLMLGFVAGVYNVMRVSGFSGARPERRDRQEP